MDADLDRELETAILWIRQQAQALPFGELSLRFFLHAGKLARVERSVVQKLLPDQGGQHAAR